MKKMSTTPSFSLKITAMSLRLQILDGDLTLWENKILYHINFFFFIFSYKIGAKMII